MGKITVYHFRVYDPITDSYIRPERKSPEDRIKNVCHGEIIEGTAEEVDEADLDDQGRYAPRPKKKTAQTFPGAW
jgi:hypothetical protein